MSIERQANAAVRRDQDIGWEREHGHRQTTKAIDDEDVHRGLEVRESFWPTRGTP
jgi:hypothetical protein